MRIRPEDGVNVKGKYTGTQCTHTRSNSKYRNIIEISS